MKEKYINLFTDFGFKKVFGEEASKQHLISFLNTLLPEKHQIQDLHFTANEKQGSNQLDRKAIFDLSCVSSNGEHFIVELQKARQNFFKDRSVFYATFPIQQQAERGEWDFKLAAVYTIGILDFVFNEDEKSGHQEVVHHVQLKDQHHQVFYDKLTFIYLTLPNFKKTVDELETDQDKWFFLFRHLHELDEVPSRLRERIFLSLFEKAQIARFDPEERSSYESSLKYYRDLKNVIDTARDEGLEQGLERGLEQGIEKGIEQGIEQGLEQSKWVTAKKLLQMNMMTDAQIAEITGLSISEIIGLRTENKGVE